MMKRDPVTTATAAVSPSTANQCGNCGAEERRLLHNVRHRGNLRRLCTTCVLRLHPQSFCPTCFQSHTSPSHQNDAVTCFKCYSLSHPNCVSPNPTSKSPYVCPLCVTPNVPIFVLQKEGSDGFRVLDERDARVLLVAARIAAGSMSRGVAELRAVAEKRGKEAAFMRKRAKEALDHLVCLMDKERGSVNGGVRVVGRMGGGGAVAMDIDGSGNVGGSVLRNVMVRSSGAFDSGEREGNGLGASDLESSQDEM